MVYVLGQGVLVVVPPTVSTRFTANARDAGIEVRDLADRCVLLTVGGPGSRDILSTIGLSAVMDGPSGTHQMFGFEGRPVITGHGTELGTSCANLVIDEGVVGQVWATMVGAGAQPAGTQAVEAMTADARK